MKLMSFLLLVSCTSYILADDSIIATVIEVHDGDTFYINIQDVHPVFGKRLPVRVSGIDTPELHSTSKDEKSKAEHAKSVAKSKLYNKQVELYNIKRDKYFRLNADVKISSTGEDFARFMLDEKLAKPYDGGTKPVWKSSTQRKIRFLDFFTKQK
jgi:endonuclease YncB( thermonuclease family)